MAAHRRGGWREVAPYVDALRVLAESDDPFRVKYTILLALRGIKPGKQQCLACGQAAQRCQLWVPPELVQLVPDSTAKPAVYWVCDAHHGQLSDTEVAGLLAR
jgi:hypothetical protein